MEIKILFGRHVWDCAQHADALGKRAFELRAPLQYTLPSTERYDALLREAAGLEATADRVAIFYDVLCEGLARHYRDYIGRTDALMDEPSVRVLEAALRDLDRMRLERDRLAAEASIGPAPVVSAWRDRERGVDSIVEHGEGRRAAGVRA